MAEGGRGSGSPFVQTPKLQVLNVNRQHSNGIRMEKNNPEQHCSPERSREVKSVFHG